MLWRDKQKSQIIKGFFDFTVNLRYREHAYNEFKLTAKSVSFPFSSNCIIITLMMNNELYDESESVVHGTLL